MSHGIDPPEAGPGPDVDAAPVGAVAPMGVVASETPDWIAPACALIAAALALTALAGWQLGLEHFTHASPGRIALPPLSARGLLLGAASLGLLYPARGEQTPGAPGTAVAGLLIALGAAVLLEYGAGVDLGLDLLLYARELEADHAVFPGRPSLLASIHFVLVGGA